MLLGAIANQNIDVEKYDENYFRIIPSQYRI